MAKQGIVKKGQTGGFAACEVHCRCGVVWDCELIAIRKFRNAGDLTTGGDRLMDSPMKSVGQASLE